MRPFTIRTLRRTSSTRPVTPRIWTLASVPVSFSGSAAITTTSALASGPAAVRATSGASSTRRKSSRLSTLVISESDPPRCTIAFSGSPDDTIAASNPCASASIATNTATVPAIPTTATTDDGQRSRALRTL